MSSPTQPTTSAQPPHATPSESIATARAAGATFQPRRRPARRNPGRLLLPPALVLLVLLALLGPLVWDRSPVAHQVLATYQGPSLEHPAGTDAYGRDLLARLLVGARWTLLGALLVSVVISVVGLLVAGSAVLLGGLAERLICRSVEALLALPSVVLALALTAILGPSFRNLLLALILASWPWYAQVDRALLRRELAQPYIDGATVAGAGRTRTLLVHVLPNVAGPLLVLVTANLGSVILGLAALSFLGLGIQPPTPEWGAMVSEARITFQLHPWQMLAPGLCIMLTVLLVNLAGDALRDRFDPRR